KVRHGGLPTARWALTTHTIRQRRARHRGAPWQPAPPPRDSPPVFDGADGGGPRLVVTRVLPCPRACFDTGEGDHTGDNASVIHPQSPRLRAREPCVWHTPGGFGKRVTVGATPGRSTPTEAALSHWFTASPSMDGLERTFSRTSPHSPTIRR